MKRRKAKLYKSPISIPEATVGTFAIKHHVFKKHVPITVLNPREAFLTGRRGAAVTLDHDLVSYTLVEIDKYKGKPHERLWMSDEPQELRQMAEAIEDYKARGRVLVGGLGLGIIATWLAQQKAVLSVDVVERSPEVIALVKPHQSGYGVIEADIYEYCASLWGEWPYDSAFLDTWQGTNEMTWWERVMPLRRIIANRFGKQSVYCWAEDQMLGQVRRALFTGNRSFQERFGAEGAVGIADVLPAQVDRDHDSGTAVTVDVRLFGRSWFYKGLPDEMSEDEIADFTDNVGLPEWEKKWGPCLKKEGARANAKAEAAS